MRALQGRGLAEKTVGPVLFDHLPSAFGIPQEAYHVLHSANEARGRNMSAIRAGTGLPDHIKPPGRARNGAGRAVAFQRRARRNPGKEELIRWVPESLRQLSGLLERGNQGNLKETNAA